MSKATKETLKKAYKPFDVVTDGCGSVGFIGEVSVNECQENFDGQISYSVVWLVGKQTKRSWFSHAELKVECNLFVKIAENMCHPFGDNARMVSKLFNT